MLLRKKHLMKILKTKRFKWLCFAGLIALSVYLLHVYCEHTGNDHEPQRGRPAQETIGKICDISDLKSFGAPPQSGDALPLDIDDWIDGNKPASHSTLVKTFASREEIHQHYVAACERQGYTIETPTSQGNDVVCTKQDGEYYKTLIEQVNCENGICKIGLELLKYPY
jgi:hypothetical protein